MDDKPRIGFIGLGVMGFPMARNLLTAGFEVICFSRTSKPVFNDLLNDGAIIADGVAEVARAASVVITMLPDSPDVQKVVLEEDGILNNAIPGGLVVDMSTIRPAIATELADKAASHELAMLDAPVSGGEQGAIDGTLSIMVGGDAEAYERALPLFEVLGAVSEHVGAAGAGQTVKAANQILVAGIIELVSEALVLLRNTDVDIRSALKVLRGGLAGSRVLELKADGMLDGQFDPGFRIDLHQKDLGIALNTATDLGVVVPTTALVAQLMRSAQNAGFGDLDHSALFKVVEGLSDRSPTFAKSGAAIAT